MSEERVRQEQLPIGFVGPHYVTMISEGFAIVDSDAMQSGFWAAGANEVEYHLKHFNWRRDVLDKGHGIGNDIIVADIRNAVDGDPSPLNDGGVLKASRGVEVGHVFKLGTVYSERMGAHFLDENNNQQPVIMGCYGLGIGRVMMSAVEVHHDERGIQWPASIAPFEVVITPIKYEGDAKAKADELYDQLKAEGVDVLLDDRDDRPGSKFADADLIGIPLRIVIGDRGLANGVVEFKDRATGETTDIALADAVAECCRRVAERGH